MSSMYLLKDMTQVSDANKKFINEIKSQVSPTVCVLRTDNALDYIQIEVSRFCGSYGILRQTICPQTLQ